MTATGVIVGPEHAKRERMAAQSNALAQMEERGRVLFEAGSEGSDPLDRAALALFKALEIERRIRGWR